MNILTITTDYLPKASGIATHIYHLNQTLARLGINTEILLIEENQSENKLEKAIENNLVIHRLKISGNLSYIQKPFQRKKIKDILLNHFSHIDIIHIHEVITVDLITLTQKFCWVWTNHTSTFVDIFKRNSIKNTIKGTILKHYLTKADKIICVSKEVKEFTQKHIKNQELTIIRNGIDAQWLEPAKSKTFYQQKLNLPVDKKIIFIPARWQPVKGIHIAMEALKLLQQKSPKTFVESFFIFAGYESGDQSYINLCKKKVKAFENISLIKNLDRSIIREYFLASNITLIPSLYETAGIVALEAMASNSLVVASSTGGLPETVEDKISGVLAEKGNPEDLFQKLEFTIQNIDSISHKSILQEAKKKVSEEYLWQGLASKTIEVYNQTLSKSSTAK
jgi:glycosyltransferase involved in cell wall biosynthesis